MIALSVCFAVLKTVPPVSTQACVIQIKSHCSLVLRYNAESFITLSALMLPYIFKRVFSCLLMMLIASAVIFFALEILPGNAAQMLSGINASPETVAALMHELGLNKPVLSRYAEWMTGIFRGDLGNSHVYASPVKELLAERLQVTLPLAFLAMMLTLMISLPAGIYAAAHQGKWRDHFITLLTELGMAIPNFWLAILLILIFCVTLQWLPFGGFPGWRAQEGGGIVAGFTALLLPAIALAVVQAAILSRFIRSAVLEVTHEKFVQAVRAKGVSKRVTLWRHVLKNASIPILTLAGMQFSALLAGAIVTENVFILPGLGRLFVTSIENRDFIVIRNALLLLVAMVMFVNMVVDCICMYIDPRFAQAEQMEGR